MRDDYVWECYLIICWFCWVFCSLDKKVLQWIYLQLVHSSDQLAKSIILECFTHKIERNQEDPSAKEQKYCKCKRKITKEIFSCKLSFSQSCAQVFFCLLKSWAAFFCDATHKAHNITVYCVYQAATKCHISCAREHGRGEGGKESSAR